MIDVEFIGKKELEVKLDKMPENLFKSLKKTIYILTQQLRNYVIKYKLSGQVLRHGSGKLWRSIRDTVTAVENQSVTGKVYAGSDCAYAAIHEYGGTTKAHIIEPKSAKVLAFSVGDRMVFTKRVHHPGSVIPERSYLRSSLKDKSAQITEGIKKAVSEGVK